MEITPYNYIGSEVGNAYFSGVDVEQIILAFVNSSNEDELAAALRALVELEDICNVHKGTKTDSSK